MQPFIGLIALHYRILLQHIEDEYLLRACAAGANEAIKQLYDKYRAKLFGVALRYTDSREAAEDVLHDSFVKIIASIKSVRHHEALYSYMQRTVVHTAIRFNNFWQNRRNNLEVLPDAPEPEHFNGHNNLQLKELLELVQSLPAGYRTVFNLFVIDGYRHDEIAELLKISEGTSKSQLKRAKELLQKKLNNIQQKEIKNTSTQYG